MSKRLIIILALAFVVGIAFAAYAEVQNVKVSGDLLMRGVARHNLTLLEDTSTSDASAILGYARVRIDADLTDNVSATVRLLNEREWGQEADSTTGIDLDLAYATMKEFLYSPLTVTVGRQELRYGNALIIGDVDSNAVSSTVSGLYTAVTNNFSDLSLRKAFDAIKATLNYDPLVVDLVYSKIEENSALLRDNVDLIGANATYTGVKNVAAEAYLWSRDRNIGSTGLPAIAGLPTNGERLNTAGGRVAYTGIKNLALGLEMAWQFGDHVGSALYPDDARTAGIKYQHKAWGMQVTSMYAFPQVKYTPALALNFTHLSGDKDRSTNPTYRGWDPMYKDQATGTLFNKILGFSNCNLLNLGGSMKLMEDVTVKLDWYDLSLVQPYNDAAALIAGRNLSGIPSNTTYTMRARKRHLADEIDLGVTYDYTEDVQLGLCGAMFIPGNAFDKTNHENATQLIGSMKVTF